MQEENSTNSDIPSRSQRRREAIAIRDMAKKLVKLSPAQRRSLNLPADIADIITQVRAIKSYAAHKRELAFLAKQLRRADDTLLNDIQSALEGGSSEQHRQQVAALHRMETWRDCLIDEGDSALEALIASYPAVDRQQVRSLIRQARREKAKNKPPRAAKQIMVLLQQLNT